MQNNLEEISDHLCKLFKTQIRRRKGLHDERTSLNSSLESKISEQEIYFSVLRCYEKEPSRLVNNMDTRDYPIIVGNAITRMSVLDLGVIPNKDVEMYLYKNIIYPLGYKAKRKYKLHKNCERKYTENKMFYYCFVKDDCQLEIVGQDNTKWCGGIVDIWISFSTSFTDNFPPEIQSIADFFGLTHPNLQKMIEEMDGISRFKEYIPIRDRN